MLLAIDFDKDFINVDGVAIASLYPFQSAGINCTKSDAVPAP
jgi:hypothetical protein